MMRHRRENMHINHDGEYNELVLDGQDFISTAITAIVSAILRKFQNKDYIQAIYFLIPNTVAYRQYITSQLSKNNIAFYILQNTHKYNLS